MTNPPETKSPAEVAYQPPDRMKLWVCSHCLAPRLYGSGDCRYCGGKLHDTAEYIREEAVTTALENERERAAGYIEAKVDQLAEGNIHELTADEALRIATAIRGK